MLRARPTDDPDVLPSDAPARGREPRARGPRLAARAALPNGRAVVGALLVVAAAVGVLAASLGATDGPHQQVVAASVDLPAGHLLGPGDLHVEPVELPAAVLEQTYGSIDVVVGSVTLAPLRAGELVQAGAVATPAAGAPPPFRELSFAVDRERALNGAIQQGERVDVLATVGSDDESRTTVVAHDVPIVAVDGGGKGSSIGAGGRLTVTVTLETGDAALQLVHATQSGAITLVRTTYAGDDGSEAPDESVDESVDEPGG